MANDQRDLRSAFTVRYRGLTADLVTEIHFGEPSEISRNSPDSAMVAFNQALWDTGASNSVISPAVIDKLSLTPIDRTIVNTVNGPRPSNVYLVSIGLPNRIMIPSVRVTDGDILWC